MITKLLLLALVIGLNVSALAAEAPFQIQGEVAETEASLTVTDLRLDVVGEGSQEFRVYNPQILGYVRDALAFVCESFGASEVINFEVPQRTPNSGLVYALRKDGESVYYKKARAPMTTVISKVECSK